MMMNNGDGTFTDHIGSTGIDAFDLGAWNGDGHDFDNNGFIDILAELDREIYLNNGDGTFTGYDLPFSRGGIGDFNNDGFLDVINGSNMWINNTNDNNWVKFNLEGLVSNKDAIGARVEIYGDFGIQVREVRAGRSFSSMSTLAVHFGLGQHESIDQVIVKWPSGIITIINDPSINTSIDVVETSCVISPSVLIVDGSTSICPGETVLLTAPSGDSYSWSNGATTQSIEVSQASNNQVTVWLNGCASVSNVVTINLFEEENPTIQLSGSDVLCAGQEVEIVASPALGYSWSNGETTQSITVSSGGIYYVTVVGLCENIELVSDTITLITLSEVELPIVEDIQLEEPGNVTLTAVGENLLWYSDELSEEAIGEGQMLDVGFISEGTWWVEANIVYGGEQEIGGKPNNSGGGGLLAAGVTGYNLFNVWEPFTLETVKVYVPSGAGDGVRTVQLVDNQGQVINSADFELTEGTHILELNFEIPIGQGLSLRCPQNTLFRNSGGVSFPYMLGTVGSIYDSIYGPEYYYFFYE
jgi:hypothetical protein